MFPGKHINNLRYDIGGHSVLFAQLHLHVFAALPLLTNSQYLLVSKQGVVVVLSSARVRLYWFHNGNTLPDADKKARSL